MRDSLKKSIEDSPDSQFERYPKGSIVICNACAKPIYKLDFGIALGDKAGKAASSFKPVSEQDILTLARREDIDAGIRAALRAMPMTTLAEYIEKLAAAEVKAGEPMICPVCHECFVQVLTTEVSETLDKSYVIEMLTIPPEGLGRPAPVRGKHLGAGAGKDWIH